MTCLMGVLRLILFVGCLAAVVVAFAIGWLLAGIVLQSIHRITQTAQAIGAERSFSRRVEHRGPADEVGQLAITFNNMLAALESGYRRLEQALESQRRFVADASHELRTPLTTVRGNIDPLGHAPQKVMADRDALKQVLLILVDNAHVHTAGTVITLAARQEDGRAAISVSDTGPGISPEALPHIFERFYRSALSRSGRSSGLGLAIAKELAERQAGTITVQSAPGRGSVFTVTIAQAPD